MMSSYRSSYGSWSKPDTTKSNTNSTPTTGTKTKPNNEIPAPRKYDISYSRNKSDTSYNKDMSTRSTSLDKPTSRYSSLSSSSFRSTYTPTYSRDKSSTRDKELLSPNTTTSSSRYSNYVSEEKPERQSVLSKYMTAKANENKPNRLSPTPYTNRLNTDTNIKPKSRDPSPSSKPYNYARSTSNLTSRNNEDVSDKNKDIHSQTKKMHDNSANERDKDIPSKKTSSLNATLASYPSFKLYQRPSAYTRPLQKDEPKVDTHPTSRFTPSSSRYSSGYTRSNIIESKPVSPTVVSPSYHNSNENKVIETSVVNNGLSKSAEQDKQIAATDSECKKSETEKQDNNSESEEESSDDDAEECIISITVVTRGTSPTPPSNSLYLRTRRADMAKTIEKTVQRTKYKGKMLDKSMQSDRLDDSTRSSRYIGAGSYSAPSYSRYIDNRYNVSSSGRYSSGRYSSYSRDSSVKSPTNDKVISSSADNSNSRSNDTQVNGIEKNPEFVSKVTETESMKISDTVIKRENNISGIPKPASVLNVDQSSNVCSPYSAVPIKEMNSVNSINLREKSKSMSPKPQTETNNNTVSKEVTVAIKDDKATPISVLREKSESMSPKPYCVDQLPPQVPKPELNVGNVNDSNSPPKTGKTTGKKIIKKIKVKSKDGEPKKKTLKKSLSNSSADSETSVNGDLENKPENKKEPKVKLKLKIKGVLSNKQEENTNESSCDSSRHSKSRSLSRTSSDSTSSMNSASDVEFDDKRIENGTHIVPKIDIKSEYSLRTSNLATSEDDVSVSLDKSRKSSSPKPQPRTEEAKSFLMRALAPVTSLFKMRQDSQDRSPNSENNYDSDQNTLNIPSIATDDSRSSNSTNNVSRYKLSKFESADKPWWLDSTANIPEGIEVRPPSRKGSSDSEKSEKYSVYKINSEEQSDKDFWQRINNNHQSSQVQSAEIAHSNNNYSSSSEKQEDDNDWWDKINNDLSSMSNTKEMSEKDWWDMLKAKNPSTASLNNLSQKISDSNEPVSEKDFWQKINNQMSTSSESEKDWWKRINNNSGQRSQKSNEHNFTLNLVKIKHIESGERAWWLSSNKNIPEGVEKVSPSSDESDIGKQNQNNHENYKINGVENHISDDESLGDRKSPEGLESPHDAEGCINKTSPYGTCQHNDRNKQNSNNIPFFISRHMDIDDILGSSGQLFNPVRSKMLSRRTGREIMEGDNSEYKEIEPDQVKIHDSTAKRPVIQRIGSRSDIIDCRNEDEPINLDDSTLQVYKDGDYGPYLDLDSSLNEQQEELEGFQKNRKNYIVLRTQLSVRVHAIREKLLNSDGRELRRALFSLKQIFQEDKDLVHEFVQNDGLDCLIRVGSGADQYYQNYILRALGQVMLYVDGMIGVMKHNASLQWLYSLIASKFRLVVKTTLKLLLVFVEYADANCMLLIKAIQTVDGNQGVPPWTNIMNLLKDYDASDTELLIYAMTLINNCLNGIPDQDTYYDQTDCLEDQGMCSIIQRYMNKQGTDLDLLRQFQIYEAVLNHEDGDDRATPPRQLEDSLREKLRHRMLNNSSKQGRKSRRHFLSSRTQNGSSDSIPRYNHTLLQSQLEYEDDEPLTPPPMKNADVFRDSQEVTALQRRRDRVQRQREFIIEQHKLSSFNKKNECKELTNLTNGTHSPGIPLYTSGLQQRIQNGTLGHTGVKDINIVNKQIDDTDLESPKINGIDDDDILNKKPMLMIDKESTVKDITEKLCSNRNQIEEGRANLVENMTGIISKAMMGLAKSKSKSIVRSPTIEISNKEVKKSESDFSWESIIASLDRPLKLKDLDFTDLTDNHEDKSSVSRSDGWVPPPPPLVMNSYNKNDLVPPPPPKGPHFNAPPIPISQDSSTSSPDYHNKSKKTIKLFWREINDGKKTHVGSLWDEIVPVKIESKILEHLFESRTKDVIKQLEINKNKEVIVLDHKRSNAINILLKKLPPPQAIKNAILKMDATVLTREGIDKLIAMLPSEEETQKIQEAQVSNPSIPLGNAEQFLLTLSSISELNARLKLWVFKLDFEQIENEIAEPYMDFKLAMEILRKNNTFKKLISAILSTGNFLNSTDAKGFQVEYLAKIHEVKDTVHKHSLLHHLCHIILDQFPETTDLYSEIGPVTRASKVNFEELSANIERLEVDCKASTNYLKEILKHDGNLMKAKLGDFLHDCAERIIILSIIKKRLYQRYNEFLLWLGVPLNRVSETRPSELFKVISEFALEYRTTRERVIEQRARKACHRERNKTRGKMIMDVGELLGPESAENQLTSILSSQDSNTHNVLSRKKKDTDSLEKMNKANGSGIEEVFNSMLTSKISSDKKSEHHAKRHTKSSKGSSNMLNTRTVGMFNNYQMRGTKKTLAT